MSTWEELVAAGWAERDVPLAPHTTYKLGGPADLFVEASGPNVLEAVGVVAIDFLDSRPRAARTPRGRNQAPTHLDRMINGIQKDHAPGDLDRRPMRSDNSQHLVAAAHKRATQTPSPACCEKKLLSTCCQPESKAACCGPPTQPTSCGCQPTTDVKR